GYVSGQYVQEGAGSAPVQQAPSQESASAGTGHVVNISSSLNVRQSASTGSAVVGSLRNGQTFNIIGKSGSWYHIQEGGVTGYVSGQYVQEGAGSNDSTSDNGTQPSSGRGIVVNITSSLRVRSASSTSSSVIGYLRNGQGVNIIGKSSGWVQINFNGRTGFVSADYIRESFGHESSASFQQVLDVMRQHLGSPYVWGGSGEFLTTEGLNALRRTFPVQAAAGLYNRAAQYVNRGLRAFDCSGLMQWGYRQVGISIGRSTWDQINDGREVSLSSLQPGDLLFYSNLQHVGMYIGNGQWIEAPNSSADVRIVSVPWGKIGRARRIL
ncbi:MAG: enterotoxin, partial [Clostridium sp.]|nr:enterotoxin [Clostridium sp.]